jgi:cytidylate kinase
VNRISSIPVLTIDGPSGTGKGTIGSYLAKTRGWKFLDSGVLYRAFAFFANETGIRPDDVEGIKDLGKNNTFAFNVDESGTVQVFVNSRDVSGIVRSEESGKLASTYAAIPCVRAVLIDEQRRQRQPPGLVADGRDMGTIVFPDAVLKIFLTASPEIRAKRRYKQLKSKDFNVNLAQLSALISERDRQDVNRAVAPLAPAPDAVVIDTSDWSISDVLREVEKLLNVCLQDSVCGMVKE